MKNKQKLFNILRVLYYIQLVIQFMCWLQYFLVRGEGTGWAIFKAAFCTLGVIVVIVLLCGLAWKIFTKEGRESEKENQARLWIERMERKREKEWRRLNS